MKIVKDTNCATLFKNLQPGDVFYTASNICNDDAPCYMRITNTFAPNTHNRCNFAIDLLTNQTIKINPDAIVIKANAELHIIAGDTKTNDSPWPDNVDYETWYKKLVNDIKKAIGEKRYSNAEKCAFEIGQGDINSIITLAIQDIRDDAGDFDQ